jgi:hypothetical protein
MKQREVESDLKKTLALCPQRFALGKEVKNDEEENVCLDVGVCAYSFNG